MRLKGRRILITGAASGIGRATAELFVKEGAKVALLDIDSVNLERVAAATGGFAVEADVRSEAALKSAMHRIADALGGIDGLVNSAAIADTAPFGSMDMARWNDVINTNLTGTVMVCQLALPWLRRNDHATIVNLASGQALYPVGASASYSASKGGVLTFSKDISIVLAPKIRVNVVCPGTTDTPMVRAFLTDESRHIIDNLVSSVPFKRLAEPIEIANAILFLTGDESSFVTGTAVAIDGGRTRH
jgi:NAD(P)-dependent dehydrogenase (short-subunit alcohol dehydrogenase family)